MRVDAMFALTRTILWYSTIERGATGIEKGTLLKGVAGRDWSVAIMAKV